MKISENFLLFRCFKGVKEGKISLTWLILVKITGKSIGKDFRSEKSRKYANIPLETYREPCQRSQMECFAKIINN